MVTDQKHSSDASSEQEVIRYTEKLAQAFGLNEQNAEMYSTLSGENRALKKQLEDYNFEYIKLKRKVNLLEAEVEDLNEYVEQDECVDRKTVVDLIHEIVPSLIGKKGKASCCSFYLSDSSEESNLVEIIEGPHRVELREKKDVPHKQQRKARPIKVKRVVV